MTSSLATKGPGSTQEIPVMDGNATSYEVSDLRPYTTYIFSVSAITEAGGGPPIVVSSTTPQGGEILCFLHTCMKNYYHFVFDEVQILQHKLQLHSECYMNYLLYTCTHTHYSSLWYS